MRREKDAEMLILIYRRSCTVAARSGNSGEAVLLAVYNHLLLKIPLQLLFQILE
jgi:hypothetical protein